MDSRLTEEQVLLTDGARRYVEQHFDYETRRKALSGDDALSEGRWRHIAEMGWIALAVPEEKGGLGGSAADFALLVEALGPGMLPEPLLPVVQAVRTLVALGAGDALITAAAEGAARPAVAHGEAAAGGLDTFVQARAEQTASGWRLAGRKSLVLGGAAATHLLISARTAGGDADADGISLFLVPAETAGTANRKLRLTDDSWGSDLRLDGLRLPTDALIGAEGRAGQALREGLAWLQLGLHAEALGLMDKALWTTRDYVRTRTQFGTSLGTFQAVQHRLADMAMETELGRSMLLRLISSFSDDRTERRRILAAAKAFFGRAGFFVGAQAVQLHGGMGMTDEYIVGMLFKRLLLLRNLHGGPVPALETLARRWADQSAESK